MFAIDDPLIALILRFVTDTDDTAKTDEEFLGRQIRAMRKYVAQFPSEEHGSRAMEWIGQHAARYRRDWERNTVSSRTVHLRCADCPLIRRGAAEHCEIHEQWLYLLHRYLADELVTRDYIENALALLGEYKERQRYRVASVLNASKSGKLQKGKKAKKKKQGKKKGKKKKRNKKGSREGGAG